MWHFLPAYQPLPFNWLCHQVNVLKIIRYLLHWKNSSSVPPPPANRRYNVPQPLMSRSSTLSQRSSSVTSPTRNSTNKSKHLGITCVRHVIQHCGAYLLDLLGPPVPSTLGMKSLMVIREAVINGEVGRRCLRYRTSKGGVRRGMWG